MKTTDFVYIVGTHLYLEDKSVKFVPRGVFTSMGKAMALTTDLTEWTIMKVLVPHDNDF